MQLSDLRPQTVCVCGVEVFGISVKDMADLFNRVPDLDKLFSGSDITVQSIVRTGPGTIALIIAAGCRQLGNSVAEENAAALGIDTQLQFIDAIIKLTFPTGVGPFVERLNQLAAGLGDIGKEQVIQSPKQ